MDRIHSAIGVLFVIGSAYIFSERPRRIPWKSVGLGLGAQLALLILVYGIPGLNIPGPFRIVFQLVNEFFLNLIAFSDSACDFLFGQLGRVDSAAGYAFALRALPPVIFLSALVSVAHYIGLLEKMVNAVARFMQKTMGASGPESINAAGNIFLGQIEAPLLIKPFLPNLTRAEIFCVMTAGMSTIAAGVMAAFIGFLRFQIPDIAGHLLTASIIAAPGSILISKILIPADLPTGNLDEANPLPRCTKSPDSTLIGSLIRGAQEGLYLALSIAAVLVAFLGVIAAMDSVVRLLGEWAGFSGTHEIGIATLLGWAFSPIAWILGCPWAEAKIVGNLLGQKLFFNEFIAYLELSKLNEPLSQKSLLIATYSLCGFANFASVGIQIAGIGVLAPSQKKIITELGFKAVLAGTLSNLLSGAIAGLLLTN